MLKQPEPEPEKILEGYVREEPKLAYDYLKSSGKTVTYAPMRTYPDPKQDKLDEDRVYEDGQSLVLVDIETVDEAKEYVDDMYAEDVYDDNTYAEDEYVEDAEPVEGEDAEEAEPVEEKKYTIFDRAISYAHGNKYGASKQGYGGSYSRAHLAGPGRRYGKQIYGSQAEAAQSYGGYQF